MVAEGTSKDGQDSLAVMQKAAQMLDEATTLQGAKELKDLALTAADWARRKRLGMEAVNRALYYGFRSWDRMGGLLKESAEVGTRASKGRRSKCSTGEHLEPTLKELGITRRESAEAQFIYSLPPNIKKALFEGKINLREAHRRDKRTRAHAKVGTPTELTGKYRVVGADPPWPYGNKGLTEYGHAESHYPSMSVEEICALEVKELVEDNAVLFLWVTSPMLEAAFKVIRAWGFEYKTSMVWDKVRHNFGYYVSVRHELLLICTRGSCTPDVSVLVDSVQVIERGAHTEKPQKFYEIIEAMYTHGARLELFQRKPRKGWTGHGNQVTAT